MKLHLLSIVLLCLLSISISAQKSGEIIFSKNMINPSSPAGLISQFQSGDNIYAAAYFEKSLTEMKNRATNKTVEVEVFIYELQAPLYDYQEPYESQLETSVVTVSGASLENKFLQIDIVPSLNEMTAYGSSDLAYKKFGPKYAGSGSLRRSTE